MVLKEKIELIISYEKIESYSQNEMYNLVKLSYDNNSFVRGLVASVLIKNYYERSKEILIRLANDKNSYVRMEAYDSLSAFCDRDIMVLLENKIKSEVDNETLSYAIISYSEISKSLNENKYSINFLKSVLNIVKADCCMLSCNYGLYLLGEKEYLDKFLSFLHSDDYMIVCSTISLLSDVIDEDNSTIIKEELIKIQNDCVAVNSKIDEFMKNTAYI